MIFSLIFFILFILEFLYTKEWIMFILDFTRQYYDSIDDVKLKSSIIGFKIMGFVCLIFSISILMSFK